MKVKYITIKVMYENEEDWKDIIYGLTKYEDLLPKAKIEIVEVEQGANIDTKSQYYSE